MATAITLKNLPVKLAGIKRSCATQAKNIQDVLEFGFDQFEQHGNTSPLSMALSAFVGIPSLATGKLKGYLVQAGFNPVKDSANKAAWIVRKSKKVDYNRPTDSWDNFEAEGNVVLIDVIKTLKSTHGRIDKGQDQEAKRHIAPEQSEVAKLALDKLTALVSELEALGVSIPEAPVAATKH